MNSPSKIKIAYLISSLSKQGPVQVLYDIVANLDYSKFEIVIITLKKELNNSLLKQFEILPIKIITLTTPNKYNLFRLCRELKKIILLNKIHILHSHCFRSLLLNSYLSSNIKSIHTIHIYPGIQSIAMNGFLVGKLINYLTKKAIKRIDYPIACSICVKDELRIKDKIKVGFIQNGVSCAKVTDFSKDELKIKLNLDPQIKYFISVGRFSKEKNFKFLISVFKKLRMNDFKLLILGNGNLYDELLNIADDTIILPGFKTNVSDYLNACDYYISSSLTEGMPLSVLEAMSVGLPLLLSDIPPHKEIFECSDKMIGVLFTNEQEKDLEKKIKALIEIQDYQLRENVLLTYNDKFSAIRMSNKYQEKYIDAIDLV